MVIHDVDDLGNTPVLGTPPLGLGELSQASILLVHSRGCCMYSTYLCHLGSAEMFFKGFTDG